MPYTGTSTGPVHLQIVPPSNTPSLEVFQAELPGLSKEPAFLSLGGKGFSA